MELVIRATVIYWFLWLVTRGTGKRSLSEMTPLDLLMIVVLGDFMQQAVTQEDMSVTGGIIAVSTFVLWTLAGDRLSLRSKSAERILEGEAVIVVRDGVPVSQRLRSERLTVDDLLGAARKAGYRDLADIQLGVLEPDGQFSFIANPARSDGGVSGDE